MIGSESDSQCCQIERLAMPGRAIGPNCVGIVYTFLNRAVDAHCHTVSDLCGMLSGMEYDAITDLAKSMYLAETPRGIWAAEDEATRLYWMRRAALRGEPASAPKPLRR